MADILASCSDLLHCTGQDLLLYFSIVIQYYSQSYLVHEENPFVTKYYADTHKLTFQANFFKMLYGGSNSFFGRRNVFEVDFSERLHRLWL